MEQTNSLCRVEKVHANARRRRHESNTINQCTRERQVTYNACTLHHRQIMQLIHDIDLERVARVAGDEGTGILAIGEDRGTGEAVRRDVLVDDRELDGVCRRAGVESGCRKD